MEKPKEVESICHVFGKLKVVRLLQTRPFIDKKWVQGLNPLEIMNYLVVRYTKESDQYLPVWNVDSRGKKVIWWDKNSHENIKKSIGGYDDRWERQKKDYQKDVAARTLFMQTDIEQYTTDDWQEAQQKYIVWCAEEGVLAEKMRVGK